jgi:tripartite-type tricarboxylate transporter receptor subunit TctC
MTSRNLISRRHFTTGALALGSGLPATAFAQSWPTKPARILVPFGAGGIADITVRIVAERLGDKLGQRFVIENQPGPGGINAARATLAGGNDGYTIALFSNGTAVAAGLFKDLRYDPVKQFMPVSTLGYFDFVFATGGESRFKTMQDLLKEARAKPGSLNIGTIATGSTQNLSAELFKTTANIDAKIVPFRNTPDVILAVMRGDVDLAVDSYASMKSNLEDGKLRALGTSGEKRSLVLPNVPTVADAGLSGYDVTSWNAFFVPSGTPQSVIDILNKAVLDVLTIPETKKQMLDLGIEAKGSTPAELAKKLNDDITKWSTIISKANIEKQ